jgi:hypothetical protein
MTHVCHFEEATEKAEQNERFLSRLIGIEMTQALFGQPRYSHEHR